MREFLRERAQRTISSVQRSGAPISHHRVHKGIGLFRVHYHRLDLGPEVMGVSLNSVMAVELD